MVSNEHKSLQLQELTLMYLVQAVTRVLGGFSGLVFRFLAYRCVQSPLLLPARY